MSAVGNNAFKESSKASFSWKKKTKNVPGSIKPVYGAQHPPIHEKPSSAQVTPKHGMKSRHKDSFQDFQQNTIDAWDDGDDDLLQMANIKMSLKDVHTTALQVINNHSAQSKLAEKQTTRQASSSSAGEPSATSPPSVNSYGQQKLSSSAPSTPNHRPNGPGLGVRLHTHWQGSKPVPKHPGQQGLPDREFLKLDKFKSLLEAPKLDLEDLRKMSWSGIPEKYRPTVWKILSGYLPAALDRREITLERKRLEYYNFVDSYYETRHQEVHEHTFRQIAIDIPRMSPLIPIFQQDIVQKIFERILYIWAIRHPASGYVQGINDLVTPFFVVFLTEYISSDVDVESCDPSRLTESDRQKLEADSFWCFSKLLDGIQDNYTFAQPGIQTKVNALKDLVSRIDNSLHLHLASHNIEYLQFSFRWMNNLLMRELPLHCVIRLWDTYLSEVDGFANFHLYVCASFLTKFSGDLLRERDFHGLMLMLQNLPTHHWTNEEIGLMLAEAYRLKYMFADAPHHVKK